ncbi:SLOG family protein [Mycolicibacterium conceptionense]|uniref:SLOG family protein n=1 Tax=Mycolicibacterium conceptionense TaxID=451644 RepID=UPI0009BAA2E7|nr:SLOG family protein [Mycolicibacterium conceptionense]
MRILITGSRHWHDRAAVERALRDVAAGLYPEEVTVVHGDCPYGGADIIAAEIAAGWGCTVEAYPAEMGADGHVLGPARNQRMVDLGADICLAFPDSKSRGTWDCVRRAEKAGIPISIDYSYVPLPANPLRWVRESGTGRLVQVAWSPHPHINSDKEPHP